MAVSVEHIPEIALTILCILLAVLAGRTARICTFISWICYSLAFYIIGVSWSPHLSREGFRDDRSASLAASAVLMVGLANSIFCRSIPNAYLNLCASYQQLVQMVFVLVLISSPWSFAPRLPFGLLLGALFLFWVAEKRCHLLGASARSRIKDDLVISEYMAKKHGDNQDLSPGDLRDCNYIVGGEVSTATYWALLRVFLKHLTNFGKEVRQRGGKNILDLLGVFFHDLQYASTPGAMACSVIRYDKLVTVQDIWKHIPPSRGGKMDICLSFALFKILRQRFRGCNLLDLGLGKTNGFALQVLLSDPPNPPNPRSYSQKASSPRAFKIIEAELSFLFDFFYGNHLPDFCYLLSTTGFVLWMTSLCVYKQKLLDERKAHVIDAVASDATIFFMFVYLGLHQLLKALLSGWQKVNLLVYVCRRRKRSSLSQEITFGGISDRILRCIMLFPSLNTRTYSSHRARQYCLLLHGDSPRSITREIPIRTKEVLVNALRVALEERDGILSDGQFSLSRNRQDGQLSWACRQEFVAEKILVWHTATTLCHVGYVEQSTRNLRRTRGEEKEIDEDHEVATMLSGYCAYLVGFAPELIADDIYATRLVFDNARAAASKRVKGEGSLEKMHESASNMTFGSSGTDFAAATKLDVVFQGKMLAAQLLNLPDKDRWRVLADIWAELMLFISPAENAAAHLEKLKTGGEFITHIWALLKHAGIPERPANQSRQLVHHVHSEENIV